MSREASAIVRAIQSDWRFQELPDSRPIGAAVDEAVRVINAVALDPESVAYFIDEDRLTEALYSFHSWEPATARSEANAIIRALSRDPR